MAKYTDPKCRLCRREGMKLFLKGSRCHTEKCAFERKAYFPGQHGPEGRVRRSEFGNQLREKQRVRRIYGLLEKQFHNYYKKASRIPGNTGEVLLQMLERRLDNVVFRLGLTTSRTQARQIVRHGHVTVNKKRVDIPSFQVKSGDVVSLKERSKGLDTVKASLEARSGDQVSWLSLNNAEVTGTVTRLPLREDIPMEIQEQLIVELYSK